MTVIDRRTALGLFAAPALAGLPALARAEGVTGDIVLGAEDAPVTVVEYASFTCPHCAAFHIKTWPEVKKNYVDTGKVRFILREVYFRQWGLWASIVARCGGEQAFYPLVDQLLKQQDTWYGVPEGQRVGEIMKIGRINGLTEEAMSACLSNREFAKALIEDFKTNANADEVESTPTFIINGEKATGDMPFPAIAALIDKHLPEG